MNNSKDSLQELIFFQKKYKKISAIDIAYIDEGQGPIIFCLPPWPDGSTTFLPLINEFRDRYRIIALDLPGWCGYSGDMNLSPNIKNYAKIAEQFILSFNINDFNILAYSIGGFLLENILSLNTLKPKKIVLVSAAYTGVYFPISIKTALFAYKIIGKLFPETLLKRLIKNSILRQKELALGKYYSTAYTKNIIFESFNAKLDNVLTPLNDLMNTKTININKENSKFLIIYGEKDYNFIVQDNINLCNKIGVKQVVIKDADHDHFGYHINYSKDLIEQFISN